MTDPGQARPAAARRGAQLLVDALLDRGVDTIFCVPGESYLAALDACYQAQPGLRVVTCRHEAGAANMAEAYGKLTGQPGVCFVTRGPGATHASVGVHTAAQDSTPMLLLVGQVPRDARGRGAFQELDIAGMFAGMARWAGEAGAARQVPELVGRAYRAARSGRGGPAVLALPEDVLTEDDRPRERGHPGGPGEDGSSGRHRGQPDDTWVEPHPPPAALSRTRELLAGARRPLVVVGGGGWSAQAARDIRAFAEGSRVPVVTSFRRQDYVDNTSACYAGHLGVGTDPMLAARVRAADLVLAVGTRLGEIPTGGYTLLAPPRPAQTLIHAHPDPGELGRVYQADLAVTTTGPRMAAALAGLDPIGAPPWAEWTAAAREEFLDWQRRATPPRSGVDPAAVIDHLAATLPADTVVANGAGNYAAWLHRRYPYRTYRTQLAPTSGAMGYGVPAAIAAKLTEPDRTVVCLAGDGCFLMSAQELATAVAHRLDVVFLVVNNAMYGTIRMHQEREYPERVIATDLHNPDFAGYARAFGAHGEVVADTDAFPPAFERALQASGPAVVELRTDPELVAPEVTLDQLRAG